MMLLDNDEKIMNAAFILLLPLISVIPKILNPLILLIIVHWAFSAYSLVEVSGSIGSWYIHFLLIIDII